MSKSEQPSEADLRSKHEELRRSYLPVERKLRELGSYYVCAGTVLGFGSWLVSNGHVTLSFYDRTWDLSGHPVIAGSLWFGSAAVSVVGWGLRNHQAWARMAAGLLAVSGAIAAVAGLIISPAALFVIVACMSGVHALTDDRFAYVLSDEYGATVRATPQLSPPSYGWLSTVTSILFVMSLVSSLMQDDREAAKDGDDDGTSSIAQLGAWEESCVHGDAIACHDAAVTYDFGHGVERDVPRAVALYERACDASFAPACVNLGIALADGDGIERDVPGAEASFVRACDVGLQSGCDNLKLLHSRSTRMPAAE